MKPSLKAIEAAFGKPCLLALARRQLEAAYAIDVDPEIERLKHKSYPCEHVELDVIKVGCPKCELTVAEASNKELHKRIADLEADNEHLKSDKDREIKMLLKAIANDGEACLNAANKAGITFMGVDTPEHLADRILALEAENAKICIWSEDSEGIWQTDCKQSFCLNEGKPSENHMKFCCYCGGNLKEEIFVEGEL